MRPSVLFPAAILVLALAREARGDEVHELKRDVPIDSAVTTTMIGLVVGSEFGKPDLVPAEPRWVRNNVFDERARDLLRWEEPKAAAYASDFGALLLAPPTAFVGLASAAAHEGAGRNTSLDALLVVEATAASTMLNQIVKFTFARERPYARYHTRGLDVLPADSRLSFYSGHTSITTALAAASGTVAYLRGYRLAPLCWIPGAAIAATTGYLRIAADKHYLSDVLVGAAAGSLLGILIPVAFHPRRDGAPESSTSSAPLTTQVLSVGAAF
jgi:membrane-associated phospholipid phosphatase